MTAGRTLSFKDWTAPKPVALTVLERASSEKQIRQLVENPESRANQKESLEPAAMCVQQAL
jgi:hypothetical protein